MLLNRFECHVEVERKNTSAIYASFFTGYDSTYRPLREWVHLYLFQVLAATDYVKVLLEIFNMDQAFNPSLPPPSSDDEHRRPLNSELNT